MPCTMASNLYRNSIQNGIFVFMVSPSPICCSFFETKHKNQFESSSFAHLWPSIHCMNDKCQTKSASREMSKVEKQNNRQQQCAASALLHIHVSCYVFPFLFFCFSLSLHFCYFFFVVVSVSMLLFYDDELYGAVP